MLNLCFGDPVARPFLSPRSWRFLSAKCLQTDFLRNRWSQDLWRGARASWPKTQKKNKVSKKWLNSDYSGRPQSDKKITQKWPKECKNSLFSDILVTFPTPPVTFESLFSLWGQPEKSLLSHCFVTLVFLRFGPWGSRATSQRRTSYATDDCKTSCETIARPFAGDCVAACRWDSIGCTSPLWSSQARRDFEIILFDSPLPLPSDSPKSCQSDRCVESLPPRHFKGHYPSM